jgi:hypothetical protein
LKFQIQFSVDRLTQSGNFENLLELNQTLLSKENLILMTFLQVYQSKKIMEVSKYLFQWCKQS